MAIKAALGIGAIMGVTGIVSTIRPAGGLPEEEAIVFLRRNEEPEARRVGAEARWLRDEGRVACERRQLAAVPEAFGVGAMDRERLAALGIPCEPARAR